MSSAAPHKCRTSGEEQEHINRPERTADIRSTSVDVCILLRHFGVKYLEVISSADDRFFPCTPFLVWKHFNFCWRPRVSPAMQALCRPAPIHGEISSENERRGRGKLRVCRLYPRAAWRVVLRFMSSWSFRVNVLMHFKYVLHQRYFYIFQTSPPADVAIQKSRRPSTGRDLYPQVRQHAFPTSGTPGVPTLDMLFQTRESYHSVQQPIRRFLTCYKNPLP